MKVAKVLIVDEKGEYLMMRRGDHPSFPNDPDLPGGTIEEGETPAYAAVREVEEEAGIHIAESDLTLLYDGAQYSSHHTDYALYTVTTSQRPTVTLSWEHIGYEWLSHDAFLAAAKVATDTYMHMVYEVLSASGSTKG